MLAFRRVFRLDARRQGARQVELAGEKEFKDLLPGCDVGATPPFGNLYGLEVIADASLPNKVTITFCAGSHTELIQLSYADFERLAKPRVADFALKPQR